MAGASSAAERPHSCIARWPLGIWDEIAPLWWIDGVELLLGGRFDFSCAVALDVEWQTALGCRGEEAYQRARLGWSAQRFDPDTSPIRSEI